MKVSVVSRKPEGWTVLLQDTERSTMRYIIERNGKYQMSNPFSLKVEGMMVETDTFEAAVEEAIKSVDK